MVQGLDADLARAHARAKATFSRSWRHRHAGISAHRRRQCARTVGAPCIHCRTDVGDLQVGIARRWLDGFGRTDALFRGGRRGVFDFSLYRLAGAVLSRGAKQNVRFAVYAGPLAAALAGSMAGGLRADLEAVSLEKDGPWP